MRSFTVPRLSARDQAVIQTVHLLGQVSAGQVLRLHFADGSPTTRGTRMRRTMTRLSEHGLVDQLPTRWVGGCGGGSAGYLYQVPGSRSRNYREHRLGIAEFYVRAVEPSEQASSSWRTSRASRAATATSACWISSPTPG